MLHRLTCTLYCLQCVSVHFEPSSGRQNASEYMYVYIRIRVLYIHVSLYKIVEEFIVASVQQYFCAYE